MAAFPGQNPGRFTYPVFRALILRHRKMTRRVATGDSTRDLLDSMTDDGGDE